MATADEQLRINLAAHLRAVGFPNAAQVVECNDCVQCAQGEEHEPHAT